MEKLQIPSIKEVEKKLEGFYKSALKDENFVKLIKKLKIKEPLVKQNISKLEDTVLELENCKTCKGLFECKNKLKGHVFYPSMRDPKLDFDYVSCKYEKKRRTALEEKATLLKELDLARMKDIDVTEKSRVEFIKKIKKFYDDFEVGKKMKGLYVHGSFGSGKTYLIAALFNELKTKKDVDNVLVYFPELLRNLRDDFDELEGKITRLKTVELLLLDDVGAENVTSWGRDEVLGTILQHRMNESLPTFFTSNLNIEELENHLSITKNSEDKVKARRIIERIKHLSTTIELEGINRRD